MLLLNPIVRKTSEKRSRWWTKLAGFGLWSLLQPICMSLNIRSIKEEHDDVYTALRGWLADRPSRDETPRS